MSCGHEGMGRASWAGELHRQRQGGMVVTTCLGLRRGTTVWGQGAGGGAGAGRAQPHTCPPRVLPRVLLRAARARPSRSLRSTGRTSHEPGCRVGGPSARPSVRPQARLPVRTECPRGRRQDLGPSRVPPLGPETCPLLPGSPGLPMPHGEPLPGSPCCGPGPRGYGPRTVLHGGGDRDMHFTGGETEAQGGPGTGRTLGLWDPEPRGLRHGRPS